jgi:hypothetical protein
MKPLPEQNRPHPKIIMKVVVKPPPRVTMKPLPRVTSKPLPLFTFAFQNTWLLALSNLPINPRYFWNINLSVFKNNPLFIRRLPAGVKLRDSIRTHREISLKCLYQAMDSGDTAAAAIHFSRKIDTWIEIRGPPDLRQDSSRAEMRAEEGCRTHGQIQSKGSHQQNSVEELWLRPKMESLVALRRSLKELYSLKNIDN